MAVTWVGSPNYTKGRGGNAVDRIVIHWMAGTLASTDSVFQDTGRQTSAHYGIENEEVHQYVKDEDTAYHSGDWNTNQRSIGIEHSAAPGRNASENTYATSAQLIAQLCKKFDIPCDRQHIIKHSQVIATACPGTIDIDRIVNSAARILNGDSDADTMADIKARTQNADARFQLFLGRHIKPDELKVRQDQDPDALNSDLIESGEYEGKVKSLWRLFMGREMKADEWKQRKGQDLVSLQTDLIGAPEFADRLKNGKVEVEALKKDIEDVLKKH